MNDVNITSTPSHVERAKNIGIYRAKSMCASKRDFPLSQPHTMSTKITGNFHFVVYTQSVYHALEGVVWQSSEKP
jgi:hypothetical protein